MYVCVHELVDYFCLCHVTLLYVLLANVMINIQTVFRKMEPRVRFGRKKQHASPSCDPGVLLNVIASFFKQMNIDRVGIALHRLSQMASLAVD